MILSQDLHGSESHSETLNALAGSNLVRSAQLIVLAGLWNDDIAPQFTRQIKAKLFDDDLLRAIAAFSIGSLGTFGVNDLATVERLLRERFTDLAVSIEIATIDKLVNLIVAANVQDAIALLTDARRSAA